MVIFSMGTHKSNIDDSKLILNSCHEPVIVSFNIENHPIVCQKAGMQIMLLNICGRSPISMLHIGVPCQ